MTTKKQKMFNYLSERHNEVIKKERKTERSKEKPTERTTERTIERKTDRKK